MAQCGRTRVQENLYLYIRFKARWTDNVSKHCANAETVTSNNRGHRTDMKIRLIIVSFCLFGCSDKTDTSIADKPKTADSVSKTIQTKYLEKRNYFNQYWQLSTRQLKTDTILLVPIDTALEYSELIRFAEENKIEGEMYVKHPPLARCGNGIFFLSKSSSWTKGEKPNEVVLTLNYGYTLDKDYETKCKYRLDSSDKTKLVLIKTQTFYNKQFKFSKRI